MKKNLFLLFALSLFFYANYTASARSIYKGEDSLKGPVKTVIEKSAKENGVYILNSKTSFDQEGRRIESIAYDKDGNISQVTTTNFDNGKITTLRESYEKGVLDTEYEGEYDDKGNMISETNKNTNKTTRYDIKYEENRVIQITGYDDGTKTYEETNKYDRDNNLTKSNTVFYVDNKPFLKFVWKYDNNLLVESNAEAEISGSIEIRIEYRYDKFDSQGNWTVCQMHTRTVFKANGKKEKLETNETKMREIEYY